MVSCVCVCVCVCVKTCRILWVHSSWNVMAYSDVREGKLRGNWRMEWVASTLHTTSEHGVSSTTTADAHTTAANSRLNWRPRRFKWTRPLRRKTKSGFCACAITFQLASAWCVDTLCVTMCEPALPAKDGVNSIPDKWCKYLSWGPSTVDSSGHHRQVFDSVGTF